MRRFLAALALLGAGMCLNEYIKSVQASRNSSGTYSVFAGTTPVVSLQTIGSSLWNNAWNDMASSMTDSLDRNGRGGMLAALRGVDGTVAAPAFAYTSETGSGEYRIGAGDLGWAILGGKKLELTGSLFTVTPAASFSGTLALADVLTQTIAGSASTIPFTSLEGSLSNGNNVSWVLGAAGSANSAGLVTYLKNATAANSTLCLAVYGQSSTLCVDGNNKTIIGGGTGIGVSRTGSTSWTPGSLNAQTCTVNTSITVSGAATGDPCVLGSPETGSGFFSEFCGFSGTTCDITVCNPTAASHTPASGTYTCRSLSP